MTRWELLLFNNGWQPFAVTDNEFWYRRPETGDVEGRAVTLNGRITGVEARS